MIELKAFSRVDWFAYAGASPFEDGSEPQIGYCVVDGLETIVIHDATGLGMYIGLSDSWDDELSLWIPMDADDGTLASRRLVQGPAAIARALVALEPEMSMVRLAALGFSNADTGEPASVRSAVTAYEVADGAPYRRSAGLDARPASEGERS